MVVYLHEALERRTHSADCLSKADLEAAVIEGAVQRLRPKLMTVTAVLASLVPILWETWHRLRRDEANRCADCWRHHYVDHSRPDFGSGLFHNDEGADHF